MIAARGLLGKIDLMSDESKRETPQEMLARAAALHEEGDQLRCVALRAALVQTRGFVSRAADLLGISRQQLHDWLRREYPTIADEARAMREASGYRGGNPMLYIPAQGDTGKSK